MGFHAVNHEDFLVKMIDDKLNSGGDNVEDPAGKMHENTSLVFAQEVYNSPTEIKPSQGRGGNSEELRETRGVPAAAPDYGDPAPYAEPPARGRLRDRLQRGERPILGEVLNRVRDALDLKIGKDQLEFKTNFVKLLDLIPRFKNDETSMVARDILRSMKSVSIKGDTLAVELSQTRGLPIPGDDARKYGLKELKIAGNDEKKVSCTVVQDKGDLRKATIKDIRGITIVTSTGKDIPIREISIDATGDKPKILATVDNPAARPSYVPENLWPARITVPVPVANDKDAKAKTETVAGAMKLYGETRSALRTGDFAKVAEMLPIPALIARLRLQGLLRSPSDSRRP